MNGRLTCGAVVTLLAVQTCGLAATASWSSAMQEVAPRFRGTQGVVLHVGDGMTYSGAYRSWLSEKDAQGASPADQQVLKWMHAGADDETDGWYLAGYDCTDAGQLLYHSYTAASGIRADDLMRGPYRQMSSFAEILRRYNPQVLVLMVDTVDAARGRTPEAYIADVQRAVELCLGNGTIPILSTLPPNTRTLERIQAYNEQIRKTADLYQIPLIDFYAEILQRHPRDWNGTLIQKDRDEPTAGDNWDPSKGGLDSNGYLLRCWLTIQKVKEVKAEVIDKVAVPQTQPVAGK